MKTKLYPITKGYCEATKYVMNFHFPLVKFQVAPATPRVEL